MKILIAPDSFKGTMSSLKVCKIAEKAVLDTLGKDVCVKCVPVADGGEGSCEAFSEALSDRAENLIIKGSDLFGREKNMKLCIFDNTAIIETAQAAGLDDERKDVMSATTFGMGYLVKEALERKCRKLIFCLGGSGTTDAGAGLLSALGVKFYDENNEAFIPCGKTLKAVKNIDICELDKRLENCEIIGACDVENPLYGKEGAAYVYAPQKGASEEEVKTLDEGLFSFSKVCEKVLKKDCSSIPGTGAAGGLGFALVAFLKGKLVSGADIVLDTVMFDELVKSADVVITGEGKTDRQSVYGKIVSKIALRSKGKKVVCLCGKIGQGAEALYPLGVSKIISINPDDMPFEVAKTLCEKNLYETVCNLFTP